MNETLRTALVAAIEAANDALTKASVSYSSRENIKKAVDVLKVAAEDEGVTREQFGHAAAVAEAYYHLACAGIRQNSFCERFGVLFEDIAWDVVHSWKLQESALEVLNTVLSKKDD